MIYNSVNILYIWEHDVSLGDSLTNFHQHLSIVKEKYPRSLIHCIVHPRTYNTGVTNIFLMKGLIDFVYPSDLKNSNTLDENYKNILINSDIDIVIHTPNNSEYTIKYFKNLLTKSIHLQTEQCNFNLISLFDYFGIKNNDQFLKAIKNSHNKNYITEFINETLSFSQKKTVGLFVGSTRPLANINEIGLNKILNLTNELNMFSYLLGTSKFNLYNINGVNWNDIFNKEYDSLCNLVGNNWFKTIELMKKLDIIICGPTGASMIPSMINIPMIIVYGGDSSIMHGCLNGHTNFENIFQLNCNCSNYPCDPNNKMQNIDKYNQCFKEKIPRCLNEEIDSYSLRKILEKI